MTQTNSEKRQSKNKRLLRYWIGLFIIGLLGTGYTTASVIYVADRYSIYVTDYNGQSVTEVITGLNGVWGLAVADNRIFWVDYIINSSSRTRIRSARIDGSNLVDVITQGSPLGIAINPNSRKLYWRDSDLKMIRSSDLDGGNIVNIVSTNDGSFGIALDIIGGKIYWTDIWPDINGSNWPVIRQSNLDGSGASNFTNPGASYGYGPNLAVDHKGGRLFSTGSPSNTCEHSLSTGEARCTSGYWLGDLSWIAIDEQQRYSFITIQQTIHKLDLELPFTSPYAGLTYPSWRWNTISGIAVAPTGGGSQVSPNVLNTPEQPGYGASPPAVTVSTEKSKHLVLLIHGWNSAPACWADAMKESIKKTLPGYTGQEGCNELIEDASTNTSWQICTYNWSKDAGFGGSCSWLPEFIVTPWDAYSEASKVGKKLADDIISHSQSRSYDFIHFIAHSAGSQVAEKAAERLEERNVKPIIHTTFLDAFDPKGEGSTYGSHSDWAEQYVDMRRVFDVGLDDTDLTLPRAYNFDITALDPDGNNVTGTNAHSWPYRWYEKTIENPANSDYGFNLSLESGRDQFPSNFPKGGKCVFFSSISTVCSESGVLAGIASVGVIIDDVFDVPKAILDATISPTGSVIFLPSKVIKLITGSPAWTSLPIEVTEPIDSLSFDYMYLREAEGLLSVFFDDQLIFRSDQRVELAGLNHSDNVPIGVIASGAHTLSFRLDAYNNTQSEIDISRIQLGKMEVSTSPVDTTPPVITPTASGTQGNNGWYKSDVTVSWSVLDSESAIATQGGCGTTAITTDTSGITFTCSATSGGGTASKSVTIQRDATVPTIAGSVSPAANANGWRNSAVTVSFTCTDATSGIATCTAPQTLGEGANQSASGTATDKADNTANTSVIGINVDLTAPTVSVTGVVNGASYPIGSVPTVGCDTKDVLSEVQTNATPSVTGGDANGLGTFTARCTGATDKAGNAAGAASVTYQVNGAPPSTSSTFSTFSVNPLRINQRLKTLFLLSNFTLGQGNNGIDPTKEPVTLTIAGFTTTISPGSFRKGPAGVYAFAGKINNVAIEMLIAPLGNNRFGFQVAAYGANLSGTKNPVMVEFLIGDDSGTARVNNAIIR